MFGFKAYIWDNLVYIGDHAYKTNEILTECLNISTPEKTLSKYLRDLEKLMPRLQIFDDDYDVETNYDRNAQHAQQLFFKIGNILQSLPPYKNLPLRNTLDQPLLFDCLNNNYHRWKTGDYEYDVDCSNEFGFVEKSNSGYYRMYVQSFIWILWMSVFVPKITRCSLS